MYIDTNRQNCFKKTDDKNNEWEYKLSNVIQLPVGSEIALQDTFIHKQGISGSTIEIEEDITETMYFSIYLSDNPHFVPKSTFNNDNRSDAGISKGHPYIPSFLPFGTLNNKAVYNPKAELGGGSEIGAEWSVNEVEASKLKFHNGTKYYGQTNASQRVSLFEDTGDKLTRLDAGPWSNLNDPYMSGYSEYPMMAVYVDNTSTYKTVAGDIDTNNVLYPIGTKVYNDNQQATNSLGYQTDLELDDPRFKPYVKSVDILIKKGVYSIGEIADLIENQINGKYVNYKNDDFYTDSIVNKTNNGIFQGTLETDGIYTKAETINRFSVDESTTKSFMTFPDFGDGDANFQGQRLSADLLHVYGQRNPQDEYGRNADKRFGPDNEDVNLFPKYNPSGFIGLGPVGFNDRYGLPYYPDGMTKNIPIAGGGNVDVDIRALPYNTFGVHKINASPYDATDPQASNKVSFLKGRKPELPNEKQLFYIPVHYYNQLVKMWIHESHENNDTNPEESADTDAYFYETGNWVENTRRLFRYGFQTRQNCYGGSVQGADGNDVFTNDNFIGLHYKANLKGNPDVIQSGGHKEEEATVGTTATQIQYNLMDDGYFVGTPEFSLSYDSDNSAFSIKGLHQSKKIPSCDAYGNPMTGEGSSAVYLRRHANIQAKLLSIPQRTIDRLNAAPKDGSGIPTNADDYNVYNQFNTRGQTAGYKQRIENALNNNEDRLGGVAIYNWAYSTALKYGDVNPDTYQDDVKFETYPNINRFKRLGEKYKKFNSRYKHLWKYDDFFSSKALAKKTWEKTIWFRLGFTYDNLQNSQSWEKCPYYDLPIDSYDNTIAFSGKGFSYNNDNHYTDERNVMFFSNEDFRIYGKTTKGEIGVDTIPTISSSFNNLLYSYTEKAQTGKKKSDTPDTIQQLIRTYDNHNVSRPHFGADSNIITKWKKNSDRPYGGNSDMSWDRFSSGLIQNTQSTDAYSGGYNSLFSYDNSMYLCKARIPVITESKSILATDLPRLSTQGYYIVTSDIVDNYQDDIKGGQPLPLLGIVPVSNLSNQDFITTKNDIIHTTQQPKNINSIKIKILNPDLTEPILLPSSSIILRITTPIPQNTPLTPQQTDEEKATKKPKKKPTQPNPHDNTTRSGRTE